MKISLVIPAYNEEKKIANTVYRAKEYFATTPYEFEILVCDDGSCDATAYKAQMAGAKNVGDGIHAGKGRAVRMGMLAATGDVIVFTDADLPYDLKLIEKVADEVQNGADAVIGSRYNGGYGQYDFMRFFYSRAFSFVTNILLRLKINDTQCGFKGFSKKAAHSVFGKVSIDGFGFDTELLYIVKKEGMKLCEIDAEMMAPPVASSVRPVRDAFDMLKSIFKIRKNDRAGLYDR